MDLRSPKLQKILDTWIEEDLGYGDLTRFVLNNRRVSGHWIAKEDGTFCGGDLIKLIFQKIDPQVDIQLLIKDGQLSRLLKLLLNPLNLKILSPLNLLKIYFFIYYIAITSFTSSI